MNKGLIEFTIERVKGELIKEGDTDLFEVASLILRDFVQGHPFVDGNKRIAFELVDILFMCVRLSNPSIHQPLSIDIWIASLAEVNVV